MSTEAITWHAVADKLPDDGTNVLICLAEEHGGEPTWIGWLEEDGWHDTDGRRIEVTHWAEMPGGPNDGGVAHAQQRRFDDR